MTPSIKPSNTCAHCGVYNASFVRYCRACGQPVKTTRQSRTIRYHVSFYLDGSRFKLDQTFIDYSDAQKAGIVWRDNGPVARSREARIGRSINDQVDHSFSEDLKYDNYRQRRSQRLVDGDCDTCKGKGRLREKAGNGKGYILVVCPVCQGMQKNYSKSSSWARRSAA